MILSAWTSRTFTTGDRRGFRSRPGLVHGLGGLVRQRAESRTHPDRVRLRQRPAAIRPGDPLRNALARAACPLRHGRAARGLRGRALDRAGNLGARGRRVRSISRTWSCGTAASRSPETFDRSIYDYSVLRLGPHCPTLDELRKLGPVSVRGSYVVLQASAVTPELGAALGPERPRVVRSAQRQ